MGKYSLFFKLGLTIAIITVMNLSLTACLESEAEQINTIIKLDDAAYKIEIDEEGSYFVNLPAGRPRIPQILCEGAEVTQTFFSDGFNDAIAKVQKDENYYSIRFTKDESLGFELQYDDVYKFVPKVIVANHFSTSNPNVATVDENGNVKIVGISEEGVTITASDGEREEKLVITRTIRAPLSVYMLTGQSNAAYYYVDPSVATTTKEGTAYHYSELAGGVKIHPMNSLQGDMSRGNIEAALARLLYDLMGEKVLIINSGVSGQKMETFVPVQGESYKNIDRVWQIVQRFIQDEEFQSKYEVRLRSYIWAQGESDPNTEVSAYKNDYLKLHQILVSKDYGFDYGFVIKVRDKFTNSAIAQEELVQENDDIIMATRASSSFSVENGKMRFDDLHYSQAGDNLLGTETAKSIAKAYKEGIEFVTGNYQ